uniref:helix-turn-helix domain-containing protein n=1 Tax=Marinobacterium profundum TaxID=1714300 RepID=UPI000834A293|nr:helix-turn-helix domain-containing protein [Marinobacterium profundum]
MTMLNAQGLLGERKLSPKEVAEILDSTVATLAVWRSTGRHKEKLPFLKIGAKVRYLERDVEAFLEGCRRTETDTKAK